MEVAYYIIARILELGGGGFWISALEAWALEGSSGVVLHVVGLCPSCGESQSSEQCTGWEEQYD